MIPAKSLRTLVVVISVYSVFIIPFLIYKYSTVDEWKRNPIQFHYRPIKTSMASNESNEWCRSVIDDSLLSTSINASLWRSSSEVNDRIMKQLKWSKFISAKNTPCLKKKQILLFDIERTYYGTNNSILCPDFDLNKYCEITIAVGNESLNPYTKHYDAAIFKADFGKPRDLEQDYDLPEGMLKFIYMLESPFTTTTKMPWDNTILASYYRGSDITLPYSKWVPFETSNASNNNSSPGKNYAEGKSKLAIIFVSHCNTNNNRLQYVNELKEYIPVDVFGACGQSINCTLSLRLTTDCMSKIISQYKFYLAFENANCRDYITEKFYESALNNSAVPVAMGAHPDDYKAAAPMNSYILVEHFSSPKHLAEYLKMLDKNDDLYNEYFKWKETGSFYNAWKDFFCRVCGMLLYSDYYEAPKWPTNKITWKEINTCLPVGKWYWNRE